MSTEIINAIKEKLREILEAANSIPTAVKDSIMDNFQVDGAVPHRHADVMRIADGLENRILEWINNLTNELRQRVDRVPQQEEKKDEEPRVDPNNFVELCTVR